MKIEPLPHMKDRAEIRSAVAAICADFGLDYWERHDREHEFPEEFHAGIANSGYLGVLIPEQYGGAGGTLGDMCAVLEEIAAGGGALNAASTIHGSLLCVPTLLKFGTEEQRKEYLPKIASGELFTTFGVTEANAGTDTTRIETRATPDGDAGYVINGAKVWNSGALRGEKVLLLARTGTPSPDQRQGEGLTLFMADLRAETVDIRPIPKIGRNALASCEVFFRDHPVEKKDVVGDVGSGFYHLLHSLNGERLMLAAGAMGLGRWALDNASRYADEREVFDRKIGKNQAVQHPLADGYLKLLAAGEVLQRGIREYEDLGGDAVGTLANAAKYLASEAAFLCADNAMQVFGGFGYAREYHIGRYWVESRLLRLAPINNQMVLNYIGERVLHLPRSY
jgi:acyl-CoA dehydrogenase